MSEDTDDGLDAGASRLSDGARATSYDDHESWSRWDASGAGELLEAFAKISDTNVRKAVLHLGESMTKAGSKGNRRL